MASDRHEPQYMTDAEGTIVKCSCGWSKATATKGKAMKAWADHLKKRAKK